MFAVGRTLCCCKLSVRPSVTRQYSVDTTEHVLKMFYHQVATPFQFFHTKRDGNIPTGTPLNNSD